MKKFTLLCFCTVFLSYSACLASQPLTAYATEPQQDITEVRRSMAVSSNEIPGWPQGPTIGSECAVLMDADTGAILYAKNMDLQKYPASITKVLTCLVAAEHCSLDEMVTFSKEAVFGIDPGSSNCGLDVGQSFTMEEALYCILLNSANEVSAAVAEHVSGSVSEFCKLMNERAKELGCTGTHFANANGLPNEEHMTTAHDMALICRAFNANDTLRHIASSKSYTVNATATQPDTFTIYNHHKMFPGFKYEYEYFTWGKTGYTVAARSTLVTCAEKNGLNLICVVMKAEPPNHFLDTRELFEYGFNNFTRCNIAENETRFQMDSADFFNADSDIFGSTQPLLALSPDGYCILPLGAEFSDLEPEVSYEDVEENAVAKVTYTYSGNYVGETGVILTDSDMAPFEFGVTVSGNDSSSREKPEVSGNTAGFHNPDVVYLNMGRIFLIGGITLGGIILILIIIAIVRNHRFSTNRKRRLKKKSRKYFSEFDDFDF
ncbi:MAG: D-alanyl-D-alanine carboxypeptidase [Lachnospiraceae bacterium]|nr:D-alanyl-D-alanine carboxypeptidase [Lachnospiraceae bacterium]